MGQGLGFLAALAWILMLLTGVIRFLACNGPAMKGLMERYAPSEQTLLPEREYAGMATMITDFLAGREEIFQYTFTDETGIDRISFHDYEQTHMEDCRQLIRLDETVLGISAALTAAFLLSGGLLGKRKALTGGIKVGLITGTLLLLTLIGIAVGDFDGLFIRFHLTAFSNDLWLLDPRTDLLIRLMPTKFFQTYGILGGAFMGAGLTVSLVIALLAGKEKRQRI